MSHSVGLRVYRVGQKFTPHK